MKVLGGLGFENAYTLAMDQAPGRRTWRQDRSAILRAMRRELSIAGDYEFFGRPEWKALRETYGLTFRAQRQMQPEFMYPRPPQRATSM